MLIGGCALHITVHITVEAITAAQGVTTLEVLCLDLLIVRNVLYISNEAVNGQNLTWGGGPTRMRKGCRAHLQRKVVVRDDAVMASTLPPIHYNVRRPDFSAPDYIQCLP